MFVSTKNTSSVLTMTMLDDRVSIVLLPTAEYTPGATWTNRCATGGCACAAAAAMRTAAKATAKVGDFMREIVSL
jgi:hypothetical protein